MAQDLDENPAFEGEPTPPTGAERRTDEQGLARSYLAPVGPYLGELGVETLQLNPVHTIYSIQQYRRFNPPRMSANLIACIWLFLPFAFFGLVPYLFRKSHPP